MDQKKVSLHRVSECPVWTVCFPNAARMYTYVCPRSKSQRSWMWIVVTWYASGAEKRDMFDSNASHSVCASANGMRSVVVPNATARTHTAQNNFAPHGRHGACASSNRADNLSASVAIPASTPFESVRFIRTYSFSEVFIFCARIPGPPSSPDRRT